MSQEYNELRARTEIGFARVTDLIGQAFKNVMDHISKLESRQDKMPEAYEANGLVGTGAGIPLTTTVTDVPGTDIVLPPGAYIVEGDFTFAIIDADVGRTVEGSLRINGVKMPQVATVIVDTAASIDRRMAHMAWIVTLWDYRQYVLLDSPNNSERFHETNTFAGQSAQGGSFGGTGKPQPRQPPAIGVVDMDGQPTYSMLFDGIADHIINFGSTSPYYSSAGSLDIWFKTSSATVQFLLGNITPVPPTGTGKGAGMYINASGQVNACLGTSAGAQAVVTSPASYADGNWHYAEMTWDANSLDLYIDGVLVATGPSLTPTSGGVPVVPYIGVDPSLTYFFNGWLDEANSYLTKHPAIRIKQRYDAAQSTVFYPSELYSALIAAALPKLWWRFDEDSGTVVADASGNGRAGTASGGVLLNQHGAVIVESNGEYNDAYMFNGIDGFVSIADFADAHGASGWIDLWFRTTAAAISFIAGNGDITAARYGTSIYMTAAGLIVGQVASDAAADTVTSVSAYNDGAWHNAVLTWDGVTINLYVDGALVATTAQTLVVAWNGYAFQVAKAPNGTARYLAGYVDDVNLGTGSVPSASDVRTRYLAGKSNRAWLTLAVRIVGGAGGSVLAGAKLTASRLFIASRS